MSSKVNGNSPAVNGNPGRLKSRSGTVESEVFEVDDGGKRKPMGVVKLKDQSFDQIRQQCLQSGKLFDDPYFPADSRSTGSAERNYEWKRPLELSTKPHFLVEGASRFDVQQGELGNCWFVAAVSSLSQFPDLFNKVAPPPDNQTFDNSKGYCGAFCFRFWVFGRWTEVVIDDRLPTINGRLAFVHSSDDNEFWSSLLEKAYAKLHGGYFNLRGGSASDAMEDFTGGVTEVFDLRKNPPDNLFRMMQKAHERHSLMGCSVNITSSASEEKLPNGLVVGHAYSVTGAKKIKVQGKPVQLVRIRNPWGNEVEWNGPWSDKSPEWKLLSQVERDEIELVFSDDGESWMSYNDFLTNFTKLEICHLGPDYGDETTVFKTWELRTEHGRWKKNVNAGGCANNKDTYYINPQFRITIVDPDEDDDDNTGTLLVAILQRRSAQHNEMLKLGYSIYKLKDPNCPPLDREFFRFNAPAASFPTFVNRREVCGRHKLVPGDYCVIPSTFEPGKEGDFLVRMFTERPATSSELDEDIAIIKPQRPAEPANEPINEAADQALRQAFVKISGDDMEVDAYELRDVLNAAFMKDFKFEGFSVDTCRSLIAINDLDRSGKLGFDEFKNLWSDMRGWKSAFLKADEDKSGTLDVYELRATIRNAGISVNNSITTALVQRYSDRDGKIFFNDYIHCISKLTSMFNYFNRKSGGTTEAKFTLDQFLWETMYS